VNYKFYCQYNSKLPSDALDMVQNIEKIKMRFLQMS